MNFKDIKQSAFFEDGSLRDINIASSMLEVSWVKLITFLEEENIKYTIGKKKYSFSEVIEKIWYYFQNLEKWNTDIEYLTINIYIWNILMNGFFMLWKGDILDIDPGEIKQEEDFLIIVKFLRKLSIYLNEKLYISPENSPEIILYKI